MTFINKNIFMEFKKIILKEIKIINELNSLFENLEKINNKEERKIILKQIDSLKNLLKQTNLEIPKSLNKFNLPKPLIKSQTKDIPIFSKKKSLPEIKPLEMKLSSLEKETLKRLKKTEQKIIEKKKRKASKYVQISNKVFSHWSENILHKKSFKMLKSNLIKANLQFLPKSYLSIILFTTFLSVGFAFFLFFFFLFFNLSTVLPIITLATEGIALRFTKVFWILFTIPLATFFMMYFYPSLEEKSAGNKIDRELPFAAIHMASIAGSMIDPSKIFSIILTTKEYPHIEREFIKLLNEINLLGYDLVTALRHSAINSPSRKLSELFNGLATTINSGGDLAEFFAKRAESLLFEYRIEREKRTRASETFMDIYISVVIAAPMILMLLLMMMKVSGLGIQLSTGMITLIMVLGITVVNIGFLTFLHLKQSTEGG